jgi:hypothetical protein
MRMISTAKGELFAVLRGLRGRAWLPSDENARILKLSASPIPFGCFRQGAVGEGPIQDFGDGNGGYVGACDIVPIKP